MFLEIIFSLFTCITELVYFIWKWMIGVFVLFFFFFPFTVRWCRTFSLYSWLDSYGHLTDTAKVLMEEEEGEGERRERERPFIPGQELAQMMIAVGTEISQYFVAFW